YPEGKGVLELENTLTIGYHTPAEHNFQNYAFENELEYGVADNFTLRLKGEYFYQDSRDGTGLHFDGAGVEAQYFFTNPAIDPIGISLLGAFSVGESHLSYEGFLVMQKDWDKWTAGYELGISTDIDDIFNDNSSSTTTGTITNAA